MIDPPQRQDTGHRCRCILTPPPDIAAAMARATGCDPGNRCRETVPPDSPFCDQCEDRHPDYAVKGFTVEAASLVDDH